MMRVMAVLSLIFHSPTFSEERSDSQMNTIGEASISHQQGKISLNDVPRIIETIKSSYQAPEILVISDTNTNFVSAKISDLIDNADLSHVNKNIETDVIEPAKTAQPGYFEKFETWWRTKYVKPSTQEVYWGTIMGGLRGTVGSIIWFSSGLDPVTASTLVVGQTLLDFANQTYFRTLDNIMGGRANSNEDFKVVEPRTSSFREMSYRLLYSGFFTYLWRGISGSVNAAASIATIQGNIEVISNVLSKSLSGAYFGTNKGKLSRLTAGLIGFQVYMIGSVITSLDLAGITLKSWTVNIPYFNFDFVLKSSTLAIIIFYTGMGLSVKYFPATFERLSKFFGNMGEKVTSGFANRCGRLFE